MKNGHPIFKYKHKFYSKPHYKVICIKPYDYYDIKPGEIFDYVGIRMCMSIYDGDDIPCNTLKHENLHYWIDPINFEKCFIPLAEWRDKQINSILNDDTER